MNEMQIRCDVSNYLTHESHAILKPVEWHISLFRLKNSGRSASTYCSLKGLTAITVRHLFTNHFEALTAAGIDTV
jgi:hypothetical protein